MLRKVVEDSGITLDAIDVTAVGRLTRIDGGGLGLQLAGADLVYLLRDSDKVEVLKREASIFERLLRLTGRVVESGVVEEGEKALSAAVGRADKRRPVILEVREIEPADSGGDKYGPESPKAEPGGGGG